MQALLRRVGLARDDASDLLRALPDARRRPLVLELGLFKTGTTAIADFFRCNGWATSHNVCKARGNETTACVRCMGQFLEAAAWAGIGRGPTNGGVFATAGDVDLGPTFRRLCGPYDVFAELGHLTATTCFLPQVEHLRTLVRVLPNACFVLNTRELGGWMRSVSSWVGHEQVHFRGVTLLKRALSNCPIWPRTAEGLKAFHREHILRARDALRGAKCAIEVDLGRPAEETAERLATVFPGTNRSCWNVVKPSPCGSEGRFSLTPCSEARRKQAMKAKIHRRARGL